MPCQFGGEKIISKWGLEEFRNIWSSRKKQPEFNWIKTSLEPYCQFICKEIIRCLVPVQAKNEKRSKCQSNRHTKELETDTESPILFWKLNLEEVTRVLLLLLCYERRSYFPLWKWFGVAARPLAVRLQPMWLAVPSDQAGSRGYKTTSEEPLSKKVWLSGTDSKVMAWNELIQRWKQCEAYVQAVVGKYTDLNSV